MTYQSDQQPVSETPAGPTSDSTKPPAETKKSSVSVWIWVAVAAVVVIVLAGLYATQTEQGRLWLLGLRGLTPVPNVVGQTQPQAQATLSAAGLRLGQASDVATLAVAPGSIISQSPSSGGTAKKDSAVDVAVAVIPTVKVPNVIGQTESDAVTLLAETGLRAGTITYVYDSKTSPGDVTAQQPSASTDASVGAAVALTVSKGTKQGQVPNVIGLSQDDAASVLSADGFKVVTVKATSTSVPAGDVAAQSPAAGVVTAAGSSVTITVSTGAPAPPASTTPTPTTPPSSQTTPGTPSQPTPPAKPVKPTQPIAQVVSVPDVVGKSVIDAVRTLRGAKLKVSFAFAPSDTGFLKVMKQDPAAGTSVDPGSTVVITIALPKLSLPEGKPTQPTPLPAEQPAQQPAQQPAAPPAPAPAQQPSVTPQQSVPTTP